MAEGLVKSAASPSEVSVVIPAFNVEHWIERTLRSVFQDERQPGQVIVVDDGSTDETARIAAGFDVELISQENSGLAAARNRGAAAASYETILFLDADDVLLPGALGRALEAWAAESSDAGICVPNHYLGPASGGVLAWPNQPRSRCLGRKDAKSVLTRNWLLANALVRRAVWREISFDSELEAAEDLDFFARALLSGVRILVLGDPAVSMTVRRPGSLTARTRLMRRARRRVFQKLWRRTDLTLSERGVVAAHLLRTSAGLLVAGADPVEGAASESHTHVLHVLIDEPGGAQPYVRSLDALLGSRITSRTVRLPPHLVTGNPLRLPTLIRMVRSEIRKTAASVVHAHGVRAAAVLRLVSRKRPRLVTVHGLHSLRRSSGPALVAARAANRFVLSGFDRVVVLSGSDRNAIVDDRLAAQEKVELIPPAIAPVPDGSTVQRQEAAALKPTHEPRVLWVGRLVEQKDPLTFVSAAAESRGARAIWVCVGDGPLLADARTLAARLGVEIRFLGWRDDVPSLLASSDVVVSTALWEGLPLALVEAAMAGRAIVATDVPGNRDVAAAGVPMLLVPPRAPDLLARAISSLLADPVRRDTMGKGAQEEAKRAFGDAQFRDRMLNLYSQVTQ